MKKFKNGISYSEGGISCIEKGPYWFELIVLIPTLIIALALTIIFFTNSKIAWLISSILILLNINYLISRSRIIFNKKTNKLKVINKNLLGAKRQTLSFDDVNIELKKIIKINYNSGWINEKYYLIISTVNDTMKTSFKVDSLNDCKAFQEILEKLTKQTISIAKK